MAKKYFGGLANMSAVSDKKDLLDMPQYNKSYSTMEKSLDFLKTTQNEIYYELHQELDNLKLENNELKLKLVLLSNSSDILNKYPTIDPNNLVKDEGAQCRLLSHHIKELNELLQKENLTNKLNENRIQQLNEEMNCIKQNKQEKVEEVKIEESPFNKPSSPLTASMASLKALNDKFLNSPSFYKVQNSDSYLPVTLQGCYILIRNLIKAKDKLDYENKKLQKKLQNCQQYFKKSEFMITKNLMNKNESSFSIVSNNSNPHSL